MTTRRTLAAALVLLAMVFLPHSTPATTYQWDGGLSHTSSANANWSTANNWTGGIAPSSSLTGTDVVFLGTASRTSSNNDFALPAGIATHSLTFNAGNTPYTLTGNTIYIGAGGLVQNSVAAQTFTGSVGVAASESWTFGAGAGAVNLAGGLNIADGGSLTVSTNAIQFSGNSGLTVGGVNASDPSGTITYGASAFTLTGGATLSPATVIIGVNGGSNTYTQDSGTLNTGAITMGNAGNATFHLLGTGQVSATSLTVGNQASSNFLQDNGTVTTNGGTLTVGYSGSGSYTINAGSLSTGSLRIGINSDSSFTQTGGTVGVTGALSIASGARSVQGTYNLSGGQLAAGSITVSNLGVGAFVQTGGSVISNGAITVGNESNASYTLSGANSSVSAASVSVGTVSIATAVFTVNSGSVNIASGGTISLGGSGAGTFTQNGGTVAIAQGGNVSVGAGSFANGTYNLNGGTLTVGGVSGGGTSSPGSTSTFNFNGGTLQANAASTTFVAGLTHAYVQAGGAKIDTNGQSITISQALVHDPALVGNAPDGGLTKLGSGTLVLSGANTYNGGTLVSGGMLEAAINGALGTGNVTLGANAFLLTLDAGVTNAIADTASLSLDSTVGGKLQLLGAAGGVQEIVAGLDFNGVKQAPGTYGATGSGAQFIDNAHFSGTGILAVGVVPEPGAGVLAGVGGLLAAAVWGRRRQRA